MEPMRSIDELTQRNVAIIAEMERAEANVRTRSKRITVRIAAWVGSWTFIITQTVILVLWILLNLMAWMNHWDPYPFILLNLALSFQSAYAAPILMISQNRQAKLGGDATTSIFRLTCWPSRRRPRSFVSYGRCSALGAEPCGD